VLSGIVSNKLIIGPTRSGPSLEIQSFEEKKTNDSLSKDGAAQVGYIYATLVFRALMK